MQTVLILFNCQQENHTDAVACLLSQLFPFAVVGLRLSLMSIRIKQLIRINHFRSILIGLRIIHFERILECILKEQENIQVTRIITHFCVMDALFSHS